MTRNKIKSIDEIKRIVALLKDDGRKIVTTNGCFDIMHIGHSRCLQEARKLGDVLIVGINTDSSVKKNKGDKRPVNNEQVRAELIASLNCVDYVFLFDDKDPRRVLEIIKPDFHAKGSDRKITEIIEKDVVEKNGGKVVLIPLVEGYSTTRIINKIIDAYTGE